MSAWRIFERFAHIVMVDYQDITVSIAGFVVVVLALK